MDEHKGGSHDPGAMPTREEAERALAEAERQAAAVKLLAEGLPNFRMTTDWPSIATLAHIGFNALYQPEEVVERMRDALQDANVQCRDMGQDDIMDVARAALSALVGE